MTQSACRDLDPQPRPSLSQRGQLLDLLASLITTPRNSRECSLPWHSLALTAKPTSTTTSSRVTETMKPFENPSNLVRDTRGMSYGKAAALAGGALAIAYYIVNRRDTRVQHGDDMLRPDHGMTQPVGTNRSQQQQRSPSPRRKTSQGEKD